MAAGIPSEAVKDYWNEHVHDLEIATHPVGSNDFFRELDEYRFDKLGYLPRLVSFDGYRGRRLLEIGCGTGVDLARFAKGGANVTGIDLAPKGIELAVQNFTHRELPGSFSVMDGEEMGFPDDWFDVVYAHGVLQYTANARKMVREIHRVLRPGGEALLMVYNKYSWLHALSKLTGVALEHEDAPGFRLYSIPEFKGLLRPFSTVRVVPERFPVATRLHHGLKAIIYNRLFVSIFNALPLMTVRPFGWHLMAFAGKSR